MRKNRAFIAGQTAGAFGETAKHPTDKDYMAGYAAGQRFRSIMVKHGARLRGQQQLSLGGSK